MSYYQGDFYRGDPGFFSFLGRAAKGLAGLIPGVGPAISKVIPVSTGGIVRHVPTLSGAAATVAAGARGAISRVGGVVAKHPVLTAAGAAGTIGVLGGMGTEKLLAGGACPRGHHISKSRHSMGKCVKNRRMNSCNPRALNRAVRRLHSFAKHYRHVVGFVSPRAKKGRMYFRKKKRAR